MTQQKCFHCKKIIESFALGNEDDEDNKYCMECISKCQLMYEDGWEE